jgi:hypothetical protein
MQNTLLTAGIACVMAALIGGGLKAFTIEIPVLSSITRQVVLGVFGLVLIGIGVIRGGSIDRPSSPGPTSAPSAGKATETPRTQEPGQKGPSSGPSSVETPSPATGRQVALEKVVFRLPGDGIPMNNARVGPFCCTGDVAIVRSTDGNPIGYIYFFDWEGKSYNIEGGDSIVQDFAVLVSGPGSSRGTGNRA